MLLIGQIDRAEETIVIPAEAHAEFHGDRRALQRQRMQIDAPPVFAGRLAQPAEKGGEARIEEIGDIFRLANHCRKMCLQMFIRNHLRLKPAFHKFV